MHPHAVKEVVASVAVLAVLLFGLKTVGALVAGQMGWRPAAGDLLGGVLSCIGAILLYRSLGVGGRIASGVSAAPFIATPPPISIPNSATPSPTSTRTPTPTLTGRPTHHVQSLGLVCLASGLLLVMHLVAIKASTVSAWAPLTAFHARWEVAAYLMSFGVLAPICEETLFRGYLQRRVTAAAGVIFAIALSSVLFGMAHWASMITMIFAGLFGLVLSVYRAFGGSLAVCCAIHAAHNLVVYGDKYFFGYFVRS
ncbi:CPBP family intramembrane glutamic endopeptidase [Roseateles terrae]|uniref:CAAX prenyl protease 2/Lysostaphin resistance protein A-like domain-containing protein n=1 Tax=Roseateles terrae TaxID=431060 RepID=A0ABR6GLQ0_9BURK|nr:CPBP family intramembrane glutamic endopeptidase [Roseateles terrae]MBB3193031.1 hypothetical protein [Roseateles terrae]OWQ89728.1 hypothetical protein CDN98_04215 [Roseateles terrae]